MARTAKPAPANLSALTAAPTVVTTTREIPPEVAKFIDNAINEYESHTDYLRLPQSGTIPAEVIDAAVSLGRDYARMEGYKLLTRGYERGKSTHVTYRVKPFEDVEDEAADDE